MPSAASYILCNLKCAPKGGVLTNIDVQIKNRHSRVLLAGIHRLEPRGCPLKTFGHDALSKPFSEKL